MSILMQFNVASGFFIRHWSFQQRERKFSASPYTSWMLCSFKNTPSVIIIFKFIRSVNIINLISNYFQGNNIKEKRGFIFLLFDGPAEWSIFLFRLFYFWFWRRMSFFLPSPFLSIREHGSLLFLLLFLFWLQAQSALYLLRFFFNHGFL